MRRLIAGISILFMSAAGHAAVPVGAKAPNFATTGALAGKPFRLTLSGQLKKGPVVLYFFPKAFTQGCTFEARAFSDAMAEFKAAGAQVIGLSGDDLATLQKFSVEGCRNAFPVATANKQIIKAYDVAFPLKPSLSNRTSYVIDRNGRIVMSYSDLSWKEHVSRSLAAVMALKR